MLPQDNNINKIRVEGDVYKMYENGTFIKHGEMRRQVFRYMDLKQHKREGNFYISPGIELVREKKNVSTAKKVKTLIKSFIFSVKCSLGIIDKKQFLEAGKAVEKHYWEMKAKYYNEFPLQAKVQEQFTVIAPKVSKEEKKRIEILEKKVHLIDEKISENNAYILGLSAKADKREEKVYRLNEQLKEQEGLSEKYAKQIDLYNDIIDNAIRYRDTYKNVGWLDWVKNGCNLNWNEEDFIMQNAPDFPLDDIERGIEEIKLKLLVPEFQLQRVQHEINKIKQKMAETVNIIAAIEKEISDKRIANKLLMTERSMLINEIKNPSADLESNAGSAA